MRRLAFYLLVVGAVGLGAASQAPAAWVAAASTTYYFHGTTADQSNKVEQASTATFSTSAPASTSPTGVVQVATAPNDGPNYAEGLLDAYWIAPFSGSVSGDLSLDWYWSSSNPAAVAGGANAVVTVFADPSSGTAQGEIAQARVSLKAGATPTESTTALPLGTTGSPCPCTVISHLLIEVSLGETDTSGVELTAHYDSTATPSSFSFTAPAPSPTPSAQVTAGGTQVFDNYPDPIGLPHGNEQGADGIGEPSVGVDWATNQTMYAGDLDTFKIGFDYTKKPPAATWTDVAGLATSLQTLDTRLIVDHSSTSPSTDDRTIVTTLGGPQAQESYSDSDGTSWLPSLAGGFVSGVDHQSLAAGPYAPATGLPTSLYPHAVYYCSQAEAAAFCARSDTGGATWGAGVPIYTLDTCIGLHGKPRVGPDGVVYVPNKNCGPNGVSQKGVVISKDNGVTWTVVHIPGTTVDQNSSDSDVAVGGSSGSGIAYYAYRDGDHHAKVVMSSDDGSTWSSALDLGAAVGVQNAQFPEVVAGDQNRAAVTFIGTGTAGDDSAATFTDHGTGQPAVWYLYVAFTYDGGQTWNVVNARPNDPVQRGGVCLMGAGCGSDRNMLDFNDATIDRQGRVEIAYTDGCTGACVSDPTGGPTTCPGTVASCTGRYSSLFSLLDQVCGAGLFAAADPGFSNDTGCAAPATLTAATPSTTGILAAGCVPVTGVALLSLRRRRRRAAPSPLSACAPR